MKVIIEKVANGYVLDEPGVFGDSRSVYKELADVFGEILGRFEGRRPSFGGDMYGEVAVFRVQKVGDGQSAGSKAQDSRTKL